MTTALITGASAGIGAEFACQLAARGDDLVLVARDTARLEKLAAKLRAKDSVRVEVLAADLSDREATQAVCDRLAAENAPIDVLVNNAGFGLAARFLDNDIADEERGLDVMVRAVLLTCHAAGNAMKARGRGAIINVSSVAGWIASGTYSAEKAFVTTFSESLASQLTGSGVTVTALCPGFTHTEFHQRADLDMSTLPSWVWLEAPDLVRDCLADVERGKVVSVPGRHWKVASTVIRHLPRAVVRSPRLASRHRTQ